MAAIAFIAPYRELADLAREVAAELGEALDVRTGSMQEGVALARAAQADGAEVIVSRGWTGLRIAQAGIEAPVIDVRFSAYDLIRAWHEAHLAAAGRTVLIDQEDGAVAAESLRDMLGLGWEVWRVDGPGELTAALGRAKEAGFETVVGKVAVARAAEKFGLRGVVIRSGREAVREAIGEAGRVLEVRRREQARAETWKMVLEHAADGIIAVDEGGRITAYNPAAEKLIGVPAASALGRRADEIIPNTKLLDVLRTGQAQLGELQSLGGTRIVTNRVPVRVGERVAGVVATFQDVTRLQQLEAQIRRQLQARGHVARYRFGDIVGGSEPLRSAVAAARRFAAVDATVLITGETGTGKEIFAQAIHGASRRAAGPFVAVNCAALPENLLESELFGYTEGAFTGARRGGKPGLFELAHGGTIFLDEISELPLPLQARLLRVLQEREVLRLGDDRVVPVDVRVIAASNRDMRALVREGRFRGDLYYRLDLLRLHLPPLSARPADVIPLAECFLADAAARLGRRLRFQPAAHENLRRHGWPGNVRELRNAVERTAILADGEEIGPEATSQALYPGGAGDAAPSPPALAPAARDLAAIERDAIGRALSESGGNRMQAARRLGISRTTLWRRLRGSSGVSG